MSTTISTLGALDTVWAVEIGAPTATGDPRPAPLAILPLGTAPIAGAPLPEVAADTTSAVVRVSDRGWITEPTDATLPNTMWPPRLVEVPAIEKTAPIYPQSGRRLLREVGEIVLGNSDGALDSLAGDWTLAGKAVVLLRAPHRRPTQAAYSEAVRLVAMRAAGVFQAGAGRLRLPLVPAASDLSVPACAVYAGTGAAEGPAELAGQSKPRLLGRVRNVAPVSINSGSLIYQYHSGPVQAVLAARDRGVALTAGADHASYAALAAAAVGAGTFATCRAEGLIRVGATPSSLTVDVEGDNEGGVWASSAAAVAERLLRGPGGVNPALAAAASFAAWQTGTVGLLLQGGTVEEAMDRLAGGVFGTWGTNATTSAFEGYALKLPSEGTIAAYLEPWMLEGPPEEAEAATPPWARAVVAYRILGTAQSGEDLAASVSAADRATYSTGKSTVSAFEAATRAAYPTAIDGPEVESVWDDALSAATTAVRLLNVFGIPRRSWLVRLGANAGRTNWAAMQPGAAVRLTWPGQAALATGRDLIVRQVSARGDAVSMVLWG